MYGLWVISHGLLHLFIALKKCNKKCNMLEMILVQGFCPLKIKVTQSSNGFHLLPFDNICSFIHKDTVTIV